MCALSSIREYLMTHKIILSYKNTKAYGRKLITLGNYYLTKSNDLRTTFLYYWSPVLPITIWKYRSTYPDYGFRSETNMQQSKPIWYCMYISGEVLAASLKRVIDVHCSSLWHTLGKNIAEGHFLRTWNLSLVHVLHYTSLKRWNIIS